MAISKANLIDNIWKEVKDKIASSVTSVTLTDNSTQTIQTYTESFPQSIIDETSDYPIIVVEPPKISWDTLTMTKKWAAGSIRIEVYTTKAESADRFIDKVIDTIETNRPYFKGININFLNLDSIDIDSVPKGAIRIHLRGANFGFRYSFTGSLQ